MTPIKFLYATFPPEKAKRLTERLEIHYTPQARQLAEHGQDRTGYPHEAMSRSPHRR